MSAEAQPDHAHAGRVDLAFKQPTHVILAKSRYLTRGMSSHSRILGFKSACGLVVIIQRLPESSF